MKKKIYEFEEGDEYWVIEKSSTTPGINYMLSNSIWDEISEEINNPLTFLTMDEAMDYIIDMGETRVLIADFRSLKNIYELDIKVILHETEKETKKKNNSSIVSTIEIHILTFEGKEFEVQILNKSGEKTIHEIFPADTEEETEENAVAVREYIKKEML